MQSANTSIASSYPIEDYASSYPIEDYVKKILERYIYGMRVCRLMKIHVSSLQDYLIFSASDYEKLFIESCRPLETDLKPCVKNVTNCKGDCGYDRDERFVRALAKQSKGKKPDVEQHKIYLDVLQKYFMTCAGSFDEEQSSMIPISKKGIYWIDDDFNLDMDGMQFEEVYETFFNKLYVPMSFAIMVGDVKG